MKRTYLSWKWFAMLCVTTFSLISFLLGGLFSFKNAKIVQAGTNEYLQVQAAHFTVKDAETISTNLNITLECKVDLPSTSKP